MQSVRRYRELYDTWEDGKRNGRSYGTCSASAMKTKADACRTSFRIHRRPKFSRSKHTVKNMGSQRSRGNAISQLLGPNASTPLSPTWQSLMWIMKKV